jgi:hypothetical protein
MVGTWNRIEHEHLKGLTHYLRENHRHVLGFNENCRDHHCKKPQELSSTCFSNIQLCLQTKVDVVNDSECKNRIEKNIQLAIKLFSVKADLQRFSYF